MKMYKCIDKDCKKTIFEDRRLRIQLDGRVIYKCPHCRGRLILLEEDK